MERKFTESKLILNSVVLVGMGRSFSMPAPPLPKPPSLLLPSTPQQTLTVPEFQLTPLHHHHHCFVDSPPAARLRISPPAHFCLKLTPQLERNRLVILARETLMRLQMKLLHRGACHWVAQLEMELLRRLLIMGLPRKAQKRARTASPSQLQSINRRVRSHGREQGKRRSLILVFS